MAYQQPYYQPPPQKRSSATWWIIGGCGVILVLTALCACGFFVLGGSALLSTETLAPAPAVAEPATVQPSAVPSEPTDTSQPPAPPTDTPKPTDTLVPTAISQPMEAVLNVDVRIESGQVYFDVETNLPDGMQFMFTVENSDGILGQSKTEVVGGRISAGPFSRKGEPYPPGEYMLSITSPLLRLQPPEVQEILGEAGENVYGEYISEGRVDFEMPFTIDGGQEELQELKELKEQELTSLQEHLSYLEDKLTQLEQAKSMDELQWTSWSREWNTDLREHKESYTQEFGANINEYKGYCRNAFLDIGIGYGDILILWKSHDDLLENQITEDELDTRKAELRTLLDEAHTALTTCWEDL